MVAALLASQSASPNRGSLGRVSPPLICFNPRAGPGLHPAGASHCHTCQCILWVIHTLGWHKKNEHKLKAASTLSHSLFLVLHMWLTHPESGEPGSLLPDQQQDSSSDTLQPREDDSWTGEVSSYIAQTQLSWLSWDQLSPEENILCWKVYPHLTLLKKQARVQYTAMQCIAVQCNVIECSVL